MKKYRVFILLIPFLLFYSCFNAETGKSLEKIDSLSVVLTNAEKQYKSIDVENLKLVYDTIKQDIDTIGKYMLDFPKNKEWKTGLSLYEDAAKDAKHFFKKNFNDKIAFSANQLKNLKIDISNNAVNNDSLLSYIRTEKEAIDLLKEEIENHYSTYERILDRYKRSKPVVDLFIDSLITANKN